MTKKPYILYAEDDADIRIMVRDFLINHGFHVISVENGIQAKNWLAKQQFDLILLDIMMPGMDGFKLAQSIRENNQHVGIIFVSALNHISNKMKAFQLNADDYLTKPFEMKELYVRIESLLRRIQSDLIQDEVLLYKNAELHPQLHQISCNGVDYTIKPIESKILGFLFQHPEAVIPKSWLMERIWGGSSKKAAANLEVQIHHLRRCLREWTALEIKTYRGIGYGLVERS